MKSAIDLARIERDDPAVQRSLPHLLTLDGLGVTTAGWKFIADGQRNLLRVLGARNHRNLPASTGDAFTGLADALARAAQYGRPVTTQQYVKYE